MTNTNLTTNQKTIDQPLRTSEVSTSSDPLAQCILSMISAMQSDFGHRYTSQYADPEQLRQYKRRLYQKLKGFEIPDIVDGYEIYLKTKSEWPPTVPRLLEHVEEAEAARRKKEENKRIADKVAALPVPKVIECDPLAMLAEAKDKAGTASKADILKNHEAVITLAGDKIRKVEVQPHHCCAVGFCQKPGVLSRATGGNGDFFCVEHFRLTG